MQVSSTAVVESCPDRLLTITEAAELTGLAVGTLYHLVSENRIPVTRLSRRCIRFRLSDLHRWWEELTEPPREQRKPRFTSG